MSKKSDKSKSGNKSGPRFTLCVPPCKRYITSGDTHSMCVVCLGAEHAMSALERTDCPHCEALPLRVLRSRKALFEEGAFTSVPQGVGPAAVEAERALHSWGSQLDLLEGMETGPMPVLRVRKPALRLLPPKERALSLLLSSSEEVDLESAIEEPLPQSLQYEELLEVVTRAVDKLNIDWPAEVKATPQRSKLDERFLRSKPPPPMRSLPFFPDLHSEISRSWERPFSARLFVPASDYYGNVVGLDERAYKAMPRVEQTLASYLSPAGASSLKAPTLPSKPLRTTSALVGKGYSAAGQAGACLHTMSVLQAYQADLLKGLAEGEKVDLEELQRTADLALRGPRPQSGPDARPGPPRAAPTGEERVTPHYTVAVSPRCPREVDLLFLPRLQDTTASDELLPRISPPGNVAEPGCSSPPRGVSRTVSSAVSCRSAVTGLRASSSVKSRGQPRAAGSLSRLFSSVEATAKCVCMGPAHCRERLCYSVRRSAAAFRRGFSHSGGPQAGSGHGAGSRDPSEEGGHRGGPSSRKGVRVLQSVLHCSKEGWGLRPIIDLRRLNHSVMKLKFKMLTVKQVVSQIRSEDWFVTIDLKDAYFHVSILPQHRKFLRFAFRGEAYQYRVLPFGLALSPRTFTKCVDAALVPLRLQGIRILNYIDDWLILAASETLAARHRDVVLAHMETLGLRLNVKKSVLSPLQRTTYLGVVGFDHDAGTFVPPSYCVDPHRSQESQAGPVTHCQTVSTTIGSDGSSVQRDTFWPAVHETPTVVAQVKRVLPRGNPLRMIKVTRRGLRALDMWKKPWFLNQGPTLGAPCRRVTLATDASLTGWGAVMSGRPAQGLWTGRHLDWHINCLEMLAVFLALKYFLPDLRDRHVLVRTDSTAVVYYINHQGGLRSRPLYKLAHQILVWSQDKLLSLRAVHIPGHLNVGADILSRQGPRAGEWMLHPEVVEQIWEIFGRAQLDLFATRENAQCPLWFSLVHPAPLGLDAMVQTWPRLRLYAFPRLLCSQEFWREYAGTGSAYY
ncbi:hypothetical protein H4Q32_000145 [Labeo rohita]|uniref:ribonuclease H n=1 Tax=Labeo rohita TaxID=84645 RepID=A0ABQ8LI28_LABRO|nr:hypothetical protein H4Q32_000145 [Labeo rohita]